MEKEEIKKSNIEHDILSEKEKEEARQNGFILVGKTGNGKTTLLNAIFNKEVGISSDSAESVTKESKVYFYKLTNGKVVTLIDTPGLGDADKTINKDIDDKHLQGITKVISDEKIHIKGILFLVNFQKPRFDFDEQDALLNYNRIFPLKNFWQNLIVIYTHFYSDPNEDDDEEEMIKKRSESNGKIFERLMEKVKDVSDVISYDDLKKKYFNSYSAPNNNKKRKINDKNREELELIFDELIKSGPLFHKVEIKHLTNHKWKDEDGKEYIGEVEIIGFFDFNEAPLTERMNIIKKEEIKKEQTYAPPTCHYSVYSGGYSSDGNLCYQSYSGNSSNSNYARSDKGKIIGGSLAGAGLIGGSFAGGVALGGCLAEGFAVASAVSALSGPCAPFVLGASVIGLGIGALFSKLF